SSELGQSAGEDAVLRCPAEAQPGVRYCSVIWYKVSEAPSRKLSGLVMKNLTQSNGTVQRYKGFVREVQILEDSQSLLLYLCFLSAPVGHQNQEKEIHLAVYGECTAMKTLFMVLAITLLIVAMLMLYCSYVSTLFCLFCVVVCSLHNESQ
uniref:CD83 molecule n=1 Tax=Astyanax mexicanus TaxID=7994 RepID=A0A3B1JPF8_ASTMX